MQNYPKHSGRRPPIPTPVHSRTGAALALALLADAHRGATPADPPTAGPRPAPEARLIPPPQYSIRLAASKATCTLCAAATGTGPVGYRDAEPVCDRCLLEQCESLGMVLALVAVTRAYAETDPAEARESLVELGGFARIFEYVAATWGPARLIADDVCG